MRQRLILSVILSAISFVGAWGNGAIPPQDTISSGNSSIFMNASSDSKPREISLGLPTNGAGVVQIFEDGLPVSYYVYQMYPYKSWHGGVSARTTGTIGPMESAMRYGEINYFVDSWNKTGSDSFKGNLNYTVGWWGQHKIDVNLSGPLGRGWGYSLSTYQNIDPGSNHTVEPKIKDRHQFYKGVLSKKIGDRGETSLVFQYVNYLNYMENYGPFLFDNDGSVRMYGDFNLGVDSYRPEISGYDFTDFMTGEKKYLSFKDGNTDRTYHLTYLLDYDLNSGNHLSVKSRFKTGHSMRGSGALMGIMPSAGGDDYTLPDGNIHTGPVQNRMILHYDAYDTSWLSNAELSGGKGSHQWRAGANYFFNKSGTVTSSAMFAHEVGVAPRMLKLSGESFFGRNSAGEYYDGFENKLALYAYDDWKASDRLELQGFLRLEGLGIHGDSANNRDGETVNTRRPGFDLTQGKITPFKETFLNGAAGLDALFRIGGGLSLKADYTFTRVHSNLYNYGGHADPNTDPSDTHLMRFGLSYVRPWINLTSQLNFITQNNYNTRATFQHKLTREVEGLPEGYTESLMLPIIYGISSIGWTTDALITPAKGLSIHIQLTFRNPVYRDFVFRPTFSDGVTEEYDFSGKNVTNLHKSEIVIDPSYTTGKWRLWASARYISRQYINKTNSLYFKGRVETFGGADFTLNRNVKLSLNLVNLLNQKGANGSISSADLVEDPIPYSNFLMSGTFIRPFTMELGVNISF